MSTILRVLRVLALIVVVGLVGLVLFVIIGSERRLRRTYAVTVPPVAIPSDSASLARGKHLFETITCALCHALDGGGAIVDQDRWIGTVAGPNLTSGRGGVAAMRSNEDWGRAIMGGVRHDGTSLIVMPSEVFTHLADSDLGALLAYLRQLPPVDREVPPTRFGLLGRALLAAGRLNILVAPKTADLIAPASPPPAGTLAYGRYLADVSGCHGCHGYGLSGGRVAGPPGLPPASNLTPTGIGEWSEADFTRAMREGMRPDGSPINEFMPWREYRRMGDDDVHALWLYLRRVPPKDFGNK